MSMCPFFEPGSVVHTVPVASMAFMLNRRLQFDNLWWSDPLLNSSAPTVGSARLKRVTAGAYNARLMMFHSRIRVCWIMIRAYRVL